MNPLTVGKQLFVSNKEYMNQDEYIMHIMHRLLFSGSHSSPPLLVIFLLVICPKMESVTCIFVTVAVGTLLLLLYSSLEACHGLSSIPYADIDAPPLLIFLI